MKKTYLTPSTEMILSVTDEMMVVVSGTSGELSDGTQIGDGGEDDGSATPSSKSFNNDSYGDLW